jgi:hypothetical protein
VQILFILQIKMFSFFKRREPIYSIYLDENTLNCTVTIFDGKSNENKTVLHYNSLFRSCYLELDTSNISKRHMCLPNMVELVKIENDDNVLSFDIYCLRYIDFAHPVNKWRKTFGETDILMIACTSTFLANKEKPLKFNSVMKQ